MFHPPAPDFTRIPAPLDTVEIRMTDGAPITLRRHGNPSGPRIVLSHGNGLAADLYYPLWSLLTDRFDLIVYDCRSHGWNPVWERGTHNFNTFVSDSRNIAEAIDACFGEQPRIGVFHSASALTALLHQQQDEDGFAALVLFDPPICQQGRLPENLVDFGERMGERTRQRKERFESRDELTESVSRSRAFQRIHPAALELFGQTTLRPSLSGEYELCCPAEYEAQIYEYLFGWAMRMYQDLERDSLSCPVKAIGSDPTIPYSFMPSMDLSTLTMMNYDFIPESTHFLPLEFPEECVALTVEFLEEHGLA